MIENDLTELRKIILDKSMEGLCASDIAKHLKKLGFIKRTGKNYDRKTINNYQSELRLIGYKIPYTNKLKFPKYPSKIQITQPEKKIIEENFKTISPEKKDSKVTMIRCDIKDLSDILNGLN